MIDHHPLCRRPRPVLIAGWDGHPLTHCPDCGRSAPADDTRQETPNVKRATEIETTPADRIERGAVREIGRAEVGPAEGTPPPQETSK